MDEAIRQSSDPQQTVNNRNRKCHSRQLVVQLRDTIPEELQVLRQWVVWRYGAARPNGKRPKIPYHPCTGHRANVTDPRSWATFSEACTEVEDGSYDGVGLVVTKQDGICGIDLDNCRNPQIGQLAPWATKIMEQINSYSEVSPSGEGLRIFARGALPAAGRKKGSIEIYASDHFLTVTGNHITGTPRTVESRQQAIDHFYHQVFEEQIVQSSVPLPISSVGLSRYSDTELLALLRAAKNSLKFRCLFVVGETSRYATHSEADLALCGLIAHYTSDPQQIDRLFRQSALFRPKWDKQCGDKTYGLLTIDTAIKGSWRWRLETLKMHLWSLPHFSGKAGPSRLLILCYLCDLAQNIGSDTVDASIRNIADARGVVKETVRSTLRWLHDHGFLKKRSRQHKRATWANTYTVSLVPPALEQQGAERGTYIHSPLHPVFMYGPNAAPAAFFSHDAFRHGGLSKNAARFLAVLFSGPIPTLDEIMKRAGLKERTTKAWAKKLRSLGLIVKTDEGWRLGPNTLDAAAATLGTTGKGKKQRAEHNHQRAMFRQYVSAQDRPGKTRNSLKAGAVLI